MVNLTLVVLKPTIKLPTLTPHQRFSYRVYAYILICHTCQLMFHIMCTLLYLVIACYASLNGQVDCGSGSVDMGLEGDNCTFLCDSGYMLQGSVTSRTCQNTGSWSGGLPSCVPLNCSEDALQIPANATVLQLPSCSPAYRSQCTVSCDEGFTGDDVTYLCNVTSDPTMVDWVAINGTTRIDHMCHRGLLPVMYYTRDYGW